MRRAHRRALLIVGALVLAQAVFVLAFVVPAHDPRPHDVPVAVVGSPAAAQALERRSTGALDVLAVRDLASAERVVLDRDAYAAVVPGPDGRPRELLVASAASPAVAQLLTAVLADGQPLAVRDLRPLDEDDPIGVLLNLLVLPLIAVCLPAAFFLSRLGLSGRGLLGATVLFAVLGGGLVTVLLAGVLGALPGPLLALAGATGLLIAAVALPAAALVRTVGVAGVGISAVLFLLIGNPGSGNASAPELLPGFWRTLGPLLPPGAGGDILRGVAYFDAAGTTDALVVLSAWALAGAGLVLLPHQRRPSGVVGDDQAIRPSPHAAARSIHNLTSASPGGGASRGRHYMQIGVDSFVSAVTDPRTGHLVGGVERMQDLLETVQLADEVGLDVFGVGEHHRSDFFDAAPSVILAAAAARTSRIRLTSAVTVLSADDPVRVFQQFATLDLISKGRIEMVAGRGSFTESFPLFGLDLADYDDLFAEKLDLLLRLRTETEIHWSGRHRPPLTGQGVYPRPVQDILPVWLGVGGTPQSFVRAGVLGLPLMIAIIGGEPRGFRPLVDLYREAGRRAGHPAEQLEVGLHCFGYIADTDQRAADEFYPGWAQMFTRMGCERGYPPATRAQFDATRGPEGAFFIGDPDAVAAKFRSVSDALGGVARISLQMTNIRLAHADLLHSVQLLGERVAPLVRAAVAT